MDDVTNPQGAHRWSAVSGRWSAVVRRLAPWLPLTAFLAWGWRVQDFVRSVPGYGDILEFTWALSWYSDALRQGVNPLFAPVAFYPGGWNLTTYATGFLFLPALLPLHRLAGAAFAYNTAVLLTFVLAFGGMYALAGRSMSRLGATVAALLYTFWGFRWIQTIGHLNILLGSACLPWMAWALERGIAPHPLPEGERELAPSPPWGEGWGGGRSYWLRAKTLVWLALAGVAWAAAIIGSMYFIWIGSLLIAGWLLGRRLGRAMGWRELTLGLVVPTAVALALSLPGLVDYWQASTAIGASPLDLVEVNFWGASLNSLPLPYVFHPWLKSFATAIYRGITYEQGAANLGLLAVLTALGGAWAARRDRRWLPVLVLTPIALVLSLGLTLKWDNNSVRWDGLRPLNAALWQLGQWAKPDLFVGARPPAPLDAAIPLPGYLLSIVVPLLERARVFARYIFIAALGVFLLAGFGVHRLRWAWARWLLAAALIFEVTPPPLERVPYPPPLHPVFDWLKLQPDGAVADVLAAHPDTLVLINRGETVWATRLHGKAAVAGASSVWPAYTTSLNEWLATHPHAASSPTFVPLLRQYGTRYVLLHMSGDWEAAILEEARRNPELEFARCFDPSPGPGPWSHPICVFQVLPAVSPTVNLVPEEGWSAQEDWGVWAVGSESRALWVATAKQPYQLSWETFPNCVPGRKQALVVEVNGQEVAVHEWADCEPWRAAVDVPAALVRVGFNGLTLRAAYAEPPPQAGGSDPRRLSVGFSRLTAQPRQ